MANRHPTSLKWAKWPAPPDVDIHATEAYRSHVREWHQSRAQRPLPVYRQELDDAMTPTIGDVRKVFREAIATSDDLGCLLCYALKRIKELEGKIAELEARKIPTYKGVWKENELYRTADLVTYGGSCWYCKHETMGRPSTNHESWQLAVKSGRDGRPR